MAGQYNLGPVKPLTEQAAYIIGPMFGITSIGGWRKSDPFPDHPSGHALDFMIPNKATGDALAAFVIANAGALGVKYVVWNRQSWNPQRGTWAPYTSTDNPHTDHVHVTFNDTPAGSTSPNIVTSALKGLKDGFTGGIPNPLDAAAGVVDVLRPFGVIGLNIASPNFWRRIGMGVLGSALIVVGVLYLNRRPIIDTAKGAVGMLGNVAGTAVQGAAFGAGAGAVGGIGAKTVTTPVTAVPAIAGPRPPAINPPSNAPTTSAFPELYAPISPGGTYKVTTARGVAKRPPAPMPDSSGLGNAKRQKKSTKGAQFKPTISSAMRSEPHGGVHKGGE